MSDFDVDAFLRSVHRKREKKTARFDKEALLKALNASLRDRMPRYAAAGRSALFVYRGDLDLLRIARGIAVACMRQAKVVELVSDDLKPGDGAILLDPLLKGEVLILVHSGTSTIPANLAEYWPRFCANPTGYVATVAHGLTLDKHLSNVTNPGAVIVVQTLPMDRPRTALDEWPLPETDAADFVSLADHCNAPVTSVGRPPCVAEPFRDNEHAYRAYRELVDTICRAGHACSVAEQILRKTIRGSDPEDLVVDFLYHGVERALHDELFYQLRTLAEHCKRISGGSSRDAALPEGISKDAILPDVYAAALVICGNWEPAEDRSLVYRGQRNATWDVVPSFFRPNRDGSPADLPAREQRFRTFIQLMKEAYPEMDDSQCMAAAQHVAKEADTPTWLIDVTWHPLVALYFASSGGQPGDIGVVDQIVMVEWKKYVAARPDFPGGFISVDVPAIERIRRQRGLFLNAPRADLYKRYFPHRICFYQQAGLVFTDPSAVPPFTQEWLLPEEPKLERVIGKLDQAVAQNNALITRPADPTVPLTAEDLLRTVADREGVAELSDYHRLVLQIVCELYACPEKWVADGDTMKYSLHRLDEVILRVVGFQRDDRRCDFASALEWSRSRLTKEEFRALLDLGYRMWWERYRVPPAVVVAEIADLLDLTRGLAPTVLGVTLPGPSDHVDVVLRTLAADHRWRVHDLRTSSVDDALGVAADLAAGGAVLIAADPTLEPYPLRFLADAVANRESAVWVGHQPLAISRDTMLTFIFGAATPFYAIPAGDVISYARDIDEFTGEERKKVGSQMQAKLSRTSGWN